jgi:hypothetical protein
MTELTLLPCLWMLLILLLSSFAGLTLSRWIPWSETPSQAGIPLAFGLAIAPFLAGFAAILALGLLVGAQPNTHLGLVILLLLALCATHFWLNPSTTSLPNQRSLEPTTGWHRLFYLLLILSVICLLANTLLLPLTQHDPLEYATVGRLLFEQRDLSVYPAIDPTRNHSGFYGPWTHPPLYPASIYLTYLLQGHADFPGLMRLIAPWYALTTMMLLYTLGCQINRLTGLLTSLIFISTPLFFLGVESGSIDALPVAGLTLLLTVIIGIQGSPSLQGSIQGLILGSALWTHSQALLFIPLTITAVTLHVGWYDWRTLGRQLMILLGVSGLLILYPYSRNITIYHAIVSDTPAVFALPTLDWPKYFGIVRGINSLSEKIQYGLLKGWFCPEAYGLSFWFMSIALVSYLRQLFHCLSWKCCFQGDFRTIPRTWLWPILGVVGCYLGMVLFSIFTGHHEIIRNERYWLILLPCTALLSAWGFNNFFNIQQQTTSHTPNQLLIAKLITLIISLLITTQIIITNSYRWRVYLKKTGLYINSIECKKIEQFLSDHQHNYQVDMISHSLLLEPKFSLRKKPHLTLHWIKDSYQYKKLQCPSLLAMNYLKKNTPKEALVLSLKPSDLYYANRRMISFLDPRLIPFYQEKNIDRAWEMLQDYGITHLHVPDYSLPPLYNTSLQKIIASPELTKMLFSKNGYQIYRLRKKHHPKVACTSMNLTPGVIPWTKITRIILGGRKQLGNINTHKQVIMNNYTSENNSLIPIFQRDWSTLLISGIGDYEDNLILQTSFIPVISEHEYLLNVNLTGHSYVKLYIYPFDHKKNPLEPIEITDIVVGSTHSQCQLLRRFILGQNIKYLRVGVEHRGQSTLRIEKITLTHYSSIEKN